MPIINEGEKYRGWILLFIFLAGLSLNWETWVAIPTGALCTFLCADLSLPEDNDRSFSSVTIFYLMNIFFSLALAAVSWGAGMLISWIISLF